MKTILPYALTLFLSMGYPPIESNNKPDMQKISTILDHEIAKGKTPSVQYLFFNADSMLYEYSAGYSNLKTNMKVDRNTTFNALSITKTFTALAIMQLVEDNCISLEKPVRNYLPSSGIPEKVLVKHLLNHTSGLANPLPLRWIHLSPDHNNFNREEFFHPILEKTTKLRSEPGSRFKYSNLGYIYLAQIIERVSGMSYEDYVAHHIFDRLQLETDVLDFEIPHPMLHATGYHPTKSLSMLLLNFLLDKSVFMDDSTGNWKPFKAYYVNGTPYGGLIANSGGLVKYGQALLKDNETLISTSHKELLFKENRDKNGKKTGMCMAWFTGKLANHRYVTHAGGGGGYYCELRLYPELKLGSFIIFNRSGFSDKRYLDKLDILLLNNHQNKMVLPINR